MAGTWDASYATVFAVSGQPFALTGIIRDNTTAQPCAVGTLTATICVDGGAAAALDGDGVCEGVTSGMTGAFRMLISAAQVTGNVITWTVASNTSNAVTAAGEIKVMDLSETTGSPLAATIKRVERYLMAPAQYLWNKVKRNKTTGLITVYEQDGTTAIGTMTRTDDGTSVTKGGLS